MTEKELLAARQSIVQKLTQARLEKGLSQEQLAKRIGTQRSNICRIEKGTQNLSLDLMLKIAEALDKDVSVMLEERSSTMEKVYSLRLYDETLLTFTLEERGLEGLQATILHTETAKQKLFPLDLELTNEGVVKWLERRVIPKNRQFVDEILKTLGLSVNNTKGIIDVCMGLSLNDSYWVVPADFDGKYADYNLYENRFSEALSLVAYTGVSGSREAFSTSPELTTNGMLIDDDVIDFANREMSNVVLSLDGRKEIHDRLRVDYAGNGSYERIVPKFQKLVKARGNKNYYMRGTFTHANPDFTKDLFHMADLGFTELSMEPVVCAPDDPAALTAEDLEIVKDQYELLAKDMLRREKEGKPITFYHYMLDLTGGPCIYKRISGCGSGTEYMAVTPWGDLYPCHQFVGEEAYKLGDIWNGVTNTALREEFRSCNAYARPECNDCWAKLYCSGGCAANAFHATGSIRGVYEAGCELFRKRIECAIMMKVAEDSAKANG